MKKIVTFLLILAFPLFAKGDLHIFDADNAKGTITPKSITQAFKDNGFVVTNNSDLAKAFKKQFNDESYTMFSLLSVFVPKLAAELIEKYPHSGVFIPLSIGVYQSKKENTVHVSVLTSEALAKIIGIKNNALLKDLEKRVAKSIMKAMPAAKEHFSEDSLKESRNLVTVYSLELDGGDWADAKDELDMGLQGAFAPKGFMMPASLDYDEDITPNMKKNPFDFYESYSICKLPVIYTVSKSRPEAAAFAPCTTMVYKLKKEDKIVLGFPSVYNWMSSARVQDKDSHEMLMKAQEEFESVLKSVTE